MYQTSVAVDRSTSVEVVLAFSLACEVLSAAASCAVNSFTPAQPPLTQPSSMCGLPSLALHVPPTALLHSMSTLVLASACHCSDPLAVSGMSFAAPFFGNSLFLFFFLDFGAPMPILPSHGHLASLACYSIPVPTSWAWIFPIPLSGSSQRRFRWCVRASLRHRLVSKLVATVIKYACIIMGLHGDILKHEGKKIIKYFRI